MHCVLCGGDTQVQLVTTDLMFRGERFWLVDIPAEVCVSCQEPYFEMAIYDEMEREAARQWELRRTG
jgi:YgiT-type zinc finger domain-containing protein